MRSSRDRSFGEWQQEQARLGKAPARGGVQSPVAPLPYTHPGQLPAQNSADSRYAWERLEQPPSIIDDVDTGNNWYSPFQPVAPFGPPHITSPREWDFPVGYNLNYIQPRMETMAMLKGMARTWGVLATIISTRQDQLLRIPWTIQRKDKPRAHSVAVEEMQKFFKSPDGKLRYSQWARKLLDDLLILDAPCLYFARDRRGRPLSAEVLSGQTIFPLIDDAGRRPDSTVTLSPDGLTYIQRQPAFQQIIKGLPMIDLDESEIMYTPMRPRPEMPMFGYPPTEQILVEASEAIKKTFYQLGFWTEGTIPDLIVSVPDTWTPRQIAMFQGHFDAMLSGNIALKSKCRFVPGGMKPFDIKNSSGESLWSQRDETLIRLACYAYSVSPAPFVKMLNRSTAQNAQQMAEEEGLYPIMAFWKDDLLDPIIQEKFGYDDVELVFLPKPEPDQEKQAKIHDLKIKLGMINRNEARDADGLEPIPGGDAYLINVGNAVIPLLSAAQGKAMPVQGGTGQAGQGGSASSATKPIPTPNNTPQRGAPRPNTDSPTPKLGKWLDEVLGKAGYSDIRDAAEQSSAHTASHLQHASGNYKKGHIWLQGLNITIENPKGSYRTDKDWDVRLPAHYGYIRGTLGADGEQVDVFVGKHPESSLVWIIDQHSVDSDGTSQGFDEHKVMLGYRKLKRALRDYIKAYSDSHGRERVASVVEMSMVDFKTWLHDAKAKEPAAEQDIGTVVLRGRDLAKADTIATATNLNWYDQLTASPRPKRRRKHKAKVGPRWLELA